MQPLVALPIDAVIPEIVASLRQTPSLVLEAPPGAGKTTRVPRALVDANLHPGSDVLVLQPRRLPTRLAAMRVAEELGERVGETVGYQVRFEDVSGPKTRLRFLTEGILVRRLLADGNLRGVGTVVLDEFHERHLSTDLSLAMLRRLQQSTRPDLRIVVMSATLEAGPIAEFLGNCPRIRSEGRRFDVKVEHLDSPDERPIDQQVAGVVKRAVAQVPDGHLLIFLPGAAEIRRSEDALAEFSGRHGFSVHALHGDLSANEQDLAVRPSKQRKLILSTNVAETSVTIDDVSVVVDSGLARIASHSPWSGMPVLKLGKISKAAGVQRAGRAGRTREGMCLRLYTKHDFDGRLEREAPEIRRADLADTVLSLRSMGVEELGDFPFFEAPPPAALAAAEALLHRLHAVEANRITDLGRRLLEYPLHPRIARILVEGEKRGVRDGAILVAALLGERDIRRESRTAFAGPHRPASGGSSGPSDVLDLLDRFRQTRRGTAAHGVGLDVAGVKAVERSERQLGRLGRGGKATAPASPPPGSPAEEQALLQAVLTGFPDRLARRRKRHAPEALIQGGVTGTLTESSVVRDAELFVVVDAEERPGKGVQIRLASAVEPEWLLDGYADDLQETDERVWNAEAQRVDRVTRLIYGGIPLEETRAPATADEETGRVLLEAARTLPLSTWGKADGLDNLFIRLSLLSTAHPDAGFPATPEAALDAALAAMASGSRNVSEMRDVGLAAAAAMLLTASQQKLLNAHAPERVSLPGGRQVVVHYERDRPPWIESRMQDFFGMAQGPVVAGGKVPVVLHLLAPNHRAVQVTTDLAGFWERHYPTLRKELMRKYPRHLWPEDPRAALTPAQRKELGLPPR